jgi:hypothetical protein
MNQMNKKIGAACVVLWAALFTLSAAAEPADYVNTPDVTQGEREIDFKFGTTKPTGEDRESASSIGFGYGVSETWFTEVYLKYKRENGGGTFMDAFEWENKFQLTQPGEYPVDIGFLAEVERPRDHAEGYEVKFGPLFQTEFDKVQLNGNIFFQRNYRAAESNPLIMKYQWQAKYRMAREFEYGFQGFGELGKWSNFAPRNEQSHLIGPAIFGKFSVGKGNAIKYNAAYLVDTGDTVHSKTFRLQAEYEF